MDVLIPWQNRKNRRRCCCGIVCVHFLSDTSLFVTFWVCHTGKISQQLYSLWLGWLQSKIPTNWAINKKVNHHQIIQTSYFYKILAKVCGVTRTYGDHDLVGSTRRFSLLSHLLQSFAWFKILVDGWYVLVLVRTSPIFYWDIGWCSYWQNIAKISAIMIDILKITVVAGNIFYIGKKGWKSLRKREGSLNQHFQTLNRKQKKKKEKKNERE